MPTDLTMLALLREARTRLADVRGDLWLQIEGRHGPKAASEYPSIVKTDAAIARIDAHLSGAVVVWDDREDMYVATFPNGVRAEVFEYDERGGWWVNVFRPGQDVAFDSFGKKSEAEAKAAAERAAGLS